MKLAFKHSIAAILLVLSFAAPCDAHRTCMREALPDRTGIDAVQ